MKNILQKNCKIILFVILFLALGLFCAFSVSNNYSSKIPVFAQEVEVNEPATQAEKTELIIKGVSAKNNRKEYNGNRNVEVVVDIDGVTPGDDVSVIAQGNTVDANVGNKKIVEISNYQIIGEDKDKYILPEIINISPVFVDIYKLKTTLIWSSSSELNFTYTGVDQASLINPFYINLDKKKVYVNVSISGYQIQDSKTYYFYDEMKNAGNYTLEAIPAETDANYELIDSNGDRTFYVQIERAKSMLVFNEDRTFVYNGQKQDASSCVSINNTEQTLTFQNHIFTTVEEGNNLTVQVYAPQSLNYWAIELEFKINVLKATGKINTDNVIKNYVYNGSNQVINSGATINNNEQKLIYQDNILTTVAQANGKYITVHAPESANYNSVSTTFQVFMQKGSVNTSNWKWSASSFVYDGNMKTLSVLNYDPGLVTASYNGASNTEAGKYIASVVFVLRDSDNYNPVTFESKEWEIKKAVIKIPDVSDLTSVYNGETQFACYFDNHYYSAFNHKQVNAGSYTVSIRLNNIDNTVWEDGSTNDIYFNWIIKKAKVATPHYSQQVIYNGKSQYLDVESSKIYTVLNQSASEIGEHKSYLVINDFANYEWEVDSEYPILTLTWKIVTSENYDEATPMLAVVITCILVGIICIYVTLHFTVVKKYSSRRKKKTNKNSSLSINVKESNVATEEIVANSDLATESIKEDIVVKTEPKHETNVVNTSNEDQKEKLIDKKIEDFNLNKTEKELELEKERKKRMLSRKKEDKKKRRKVAIKSAQPKKRGRPPKKQTKPRGRPRRDVSKSKSVGVGKTKTTTSAKASKTRARSTTKTNQ